MAQELGPDLDLVVNMAGGNTDSGRPGGSIVTIGSTGAEYAATSYGAAKAALAAWTPPARE
ncbi:hypothetical protein [Nocardia mikamii]|uniref:hypothetical protein n=1 Tax=Nocardia mikamii TaxID=508464 RepID=UPI000B032C32|nr:hypothetical protein [Nocardia mikamii]